MNRDKIINQMVSDDCETIRQWVVQGCYEELFSFVREMMNYDNFTNAELMTEVALKLDEDEE